MAVKIFGRLKELGVMGSIVWIFVQHIYLRLVKNKQPYILMTKYARYPLLCRPGTSDIWVFDQIFLEREYRCIDDFPDAGLIIDCGAYVGYSSAYLLSRFQNADLVAIEPDADNYSLLTKNLKPYKDRVKTLNSGVWSHSTPLTMSEIVYGTGEAWSHQVRECRPGETALFSGVDIGGILKGSRHSRISILKIDIEGAEGVIFSSPSYKAWIDKVDIIMIELHDNSSFGKCSEIFLSAMEKEDFDISRSGELTVCKRRHTRQGI